MKRGATPTAEKRNWLIDSYPVTQQEVLDQATIVSGQSVYSIATAKRVLEDDGREVSRSKQ